MRTDDRAGGPASLPTSIRYGHTSIVAADWRRLVDFYVSVFGCEVVPPIRNYTPEQLEPVTGIPGAAVQGAHVRLPGHGPNGPTLEIYQYSKIAERSRPAINRAGLAHIAFVVEDVAMLRDAVLRAGGGAMGDIGMITLADGRRVMFCYLTDPEGNIVEPLAFPPAADAAG